MLSLNPDGNTGSKPETSCKIKDKDDIHLKFGQFKNQRKDLI
jgi:hypothetical protein